MSIKNIFKFLFSKEYEGFRVVVNILMSKRFTRGSEIGFRVGARHYTIVVNNLVGK